MSDDAASQALREGSPEVLRAGLRDLLVDGRLQWVRDGRDLLVSLAPYHDCARRLGLDVEAVFDAAADAGSPTVRDLVREFGRRRDVRLRAFGFLLEKGPDGPRYRYEG